MLSNHNNSQMSLNSQQHLQGLRAVGLMPNPRPHAKSQKRKLELKCEYCPSTFISNNNLRRHIYELHKDYITHLPAPPEINCDKNLHCRRCDLKFENKLAWIEHKVTEARSMKPYGPFQWGCDLCGAYVSRKEKLINHIHNHMKENFIVPVKQQIKQELAQATAAANAVVKQEEKPLTSVVIKQEIMDNDNQEAEESTEEDGSVLSGKGAYGEEYEAVEVDAEVDEDDADEDEEEEEEDDLEGSSDVPVVNVNENANDGQAERSDEEEEEEEEEDDEDEDEEEENNDEEEVAETDDTSNQSIAENSAQQINNNDNVDSSNTELDDTSKDVDEDEEMDGEENTVSSLDDADQIKEAQSNFPCDLCHISFKSYSELQGHVKVHFHNVPGPVTFSNKSKHNPRTNNNGTDAISTS